MAEPQNSKTKQQLQQELEETQEQLVLAQNRMLEMMGENAKERASFEKEKQEMRNLLREYRMVADYNIELVEELRNSRSYRMMAPLRKLRRML